MQPPLLIVFSHLRWNFVYRRAPHLMSRLAGRWRVLFVEEPVHDSASPWLEEQWLDEHLRVLVPHQPLATTGLLDDDHLAVLQGLVAGHLRRTAQHVDVAWLCTPLALPLLQTVAPACVVYDCMDEWAACEGAPRQSRPREAALLERAALVLTGGPSLYESRRHRHAHVVCLPGAVDAAHYAPDRLQMDGLLAREAHTLQGGLGRPRLGYFGIIDRRLDMELVVQLADAHPEWQLVMVGPVVGIDPSGLPRRPNIHWLGLQPDARLPYLLAGWDLCLMPFVLNDSTRYISPTQTLEYMAGGKPVLSTPVHDVSWMYSDAVAIAPRGQAFVEACESLLAESPSERAQRALAMLATVSASSWERSAQAVHKLLLQALRDARERHGPPLLRRAVAAGA
jgi:UDP-galactopyranose mutase